MIDAIPPAQLEELCHQFAQFRYDPVGFVYYAFPWGEPGTSLANSEGPDMWQLETLDAIGKGIHPAEIMQLATASGHGIGKSALVAWLIIWSMATAADTRGYVTANTDTQLRTKTWTEVTKWYHLFIGKPLFVLEATSLFSRQPGHEKTWRFDATPWSEHNTEAFAGLHNAGRRTVLIFDEASNIADPVWPVAEGALSDKDTERLWCVFGNPTKNTGRFRDCFFKYASFWRHKQIDSRSVKIYDQSLARKLIMQYGDDSDEVRVRVKGQFPKAATTQFFPSDLIQKCIAYNAVTTIQDALVLGVDVARFGDDKSVIYPRKGRDARSFPIAKYSGLDGNDLAGEVMVLQQRYGADAVFVDAGGVGASCYDALVRRNCHGLVGVQFGAKAGGANTPVFEKYANKRSEMHGALRAAMRAGLALPGDEHDLINQLGAVMYGFDVNDAILLMKKEKMKEISGSPDDLDALALTYAYPVQAGSYASRVMGGGPSRYGATGGGRILVEDDPY